MKAKLFYNQGRSVRLERIAFYVNLYTCQNYPIDFKLCMVIRVIVLRFRMRGNSIIVTGQNVRTSILNKFVYDTIIRLISIIKYWFLGQQITTHGNKRHFSKKLNDGLKFTEYPKHASESCFHLILIIKWPSIKFSCLTFYKLCRESSYHQMMKNKWYSIEFSW